MRVIITVVSTLPLKPLVVACVLAVGTKNRCCLSART
jgi:hypothetical protein